MISARAARLVSMFTATASDWGAAGGFSAVFLSRLPGSETRIAQLRDGPFFYRGRMDHAVLAQFALPFAYIEEGARPVRFVVDAGANIGTFSRLALRLYPQARVCALEADPENAAVLSANLAGHARATVASAALWCSSGTVTLHSGDGPEGRFVSSQPCGRKVPALCLSEIMDLCGSEQIDLLKMDIEGAERQVFEALSPDLLARINAIQFECNDTGAPGTAMTVLGRLMGDDFDAFATGENILLVRRRTGWRVLRHTPGSGPFPAN